jgi:hypothetical protein
MLQTAKTCTYIVPGKQEAEQWMSCDQPIPIIHQHLYQVRSSETLTVYHSEFRHSPARFIHNGRDQLVLIVVDDSVSNTEQLKLKSATTLQYHQFETNDDANWLRLLIMHDGRARSVQPTGR